MTEHFCTVHNCKFYRNEKEGRVWYSHKIKDGSGYCNEPKQEQPSESVKVETVPVPGVEIPHDTHSPKTPAPPQPAKPTPAKGFDIERVRSQSLSYAKDLVESTLVQGKPMTAASIALVIKIAYLFERYICGDLVISDEVTAETIAMLTRKVAEGDVK